MTYRRALHRVAAAMGFGLIRSSHHLIWRHERSGAVVATSSTPSDRHALNQAQRQFRRAIRQHHTTA